MQLRELAPEVDTHTHTILSGHAWSTLRENCAAAKARGIRFGRPPQPLPNNFMDTYQQWKCGKITGTRAAEECGMPLSTFRYKAKIYEKSLLI